MCLLDLTLLQCVVIIMPLALLRGTAVIVLLLHVAYIPIWNILKVGDLSVLVKFRSSFDEIGSIV